MQPIITDPLTLIVTESLVDASLKKAIIKLGSSLREFPQRRSVNRGVWDGQAIVVKRYWPHCKQQRDIQREWAALKRLHALNLPIPKPLFMGKSGTVFCTVTRYCEGAVTFKTALEQADSSSKRESLLRHLFDHIALQHSLGLYQQDNHLDNYLWDGQSLLSLDASSFYFGSQHPLAFQKRLKNLALLLANIDLPWEKEAEMALATYWKRLPTARSQLEVKLAQAIPEQRRYRLRRYLKKTQRTCTAFISQSQAGYSFLCDRKLTASAQNAFRFQLDALIEQGELIKDGNSSTIAEIRVDQRHYVVKRYQAKSLFYRLRRSLYPSRARRSWMLAQGCLLYGIPAPLPWACLEEKQGALVKRGFLVMDKVSGIPLDRFIESHLEEPIVLKKIAQQFAALWAMMGKLKVAHGDMKATNLLVSADGQQMVLIDLDHFSFFLPPLLFSLRRRRDKRRFMQNWQARPGVEALFRASLDRVEGRV